VFVGAPTRRFSRHGLGTDFEDRGFGNRSLDILLIYVLRLLNFMCLGVQTFQPELCLQRHHDLLKPYTQPLPTCLSLFLPFASAVPV
jgi:hypothetical protein